MLVHNGDLYPMRERERDLFDPINPVKFRE